MTFNMHLQKTIISLLEGYEDVKKQHGEEWHRPIEQIYHNILPVGDKSDRMLSHAIKIVKNSGIYEPFYDYELSEEDTHNLKTMYHLVNHFNLKNQLNKVDNMIDLENLTHPYKEKYELAVAKKSSPIVYEDNDVIVRRHNTHESSKLAAMLHPDNPEFNHLKYKGKAAWCVSLDGDNGRHYYNKYTEGGKYPMYTLEDKHSKKKYAIIGDTDTPMNSLEFRDEYDSKLRPDFFEKAYPHLLNANNGEFNMFLKHVAVNHAIDSKISANSDITGQDFDDYVKSNKSSLESTIHETLASYPKLQKTPSVIDFYTNIIDKDLSGNSYLKSSIIDNFDLPSHVLDNYIKRNSNAKYITGHMSSAIAHRNTPSHHAQAIIEDMLNGNYNDLGVGAVKHPSLTKGQISSLLHNHYKHIGSDVVRNIIDHPKTSRGEIINYINRVAYTHNHVLTTIHAIESPKLTSDDLNNIHNKLGEGYEYLQNSFLINPNGDAKLHSKIRKEMVNTMQNPYNYDDADGNNNYINSLIRHTPTKEEYKNEINESGLHRNTLAMIYRSKRLPDSVRSALDEIHPGLGYM